MGLCESTPDGRPLKPLYKRDDIKDFEAIGLTTPDIEHFSDTFRRFDILNKEALRIDDYLLDLKLTRNLMTSQIFNFMDGSGDNEISFREFVFYNWQFLSMSDRDIAGFSFDLYDVERDGKLSVSELEAALGVVHGGEGFLDPQFQKKLDALLALMDADKDANVTRKEYQAHIRDFPALLFPVFEIQVYWCIYSLLYVGV